MDPSVRVQELIVGSNNPELDQPTREAITAELLSYTGSPDGLLLFLQLLRDPASMELIKVGSAIYATQCLMNIWDDIPLEQQAQVRGMILEILVSGAINNNVLNTLMKGIAFVYDRTPDEESNQWPELFQFVLHSVDAGNNNWYAATRIACEIQEFMAPQVYDAAAEVLMKLAFGGFQTGDQDIIIQAMGIYEGYARLSTTHQLPPVDGMIEIVLQIASSSPEIFNDNNFCQFWTSLGDTVEAAGESVPKELLGQILQIAVTLASREDEVMDPYMRSTVLSGILPILKDTPGELLEGILGLLVKINAMILSIEGCIENTNMEHFEEISDHFDHEAVYPILQKFIQETMNAPNMFIQASGLLIFHEMLMNFSDCAYRDAGNIASVTEAAFKSGNPLLKSCALYVMDAFGQAENIHHYSVKFTPMLLESMVDADPDIRERAYKCIVSILDDADTEIEGMFDAVWGVQPSVPPDDVYKYVELLALLLEISELDDERLEAVIGLYAQIMNMDNQENSMEKASCLELACAIIHHDEAQTEDVLRLAFPVFQFLWSTDDETHYNIMKCMDFIGKITTIIREQTFAIMGEPIKAMIGILERGDTLETNLAECTVKNSSIVAKFADDATRGAICERIYPQIIRGFESGAVSHNTEEGDGVDFSGCPFTQTCAGASKRLARYWPPEVTIALVDHLIKIACEETFVDVVETCMRSIARHILLAPGDDAFKVALLERTAVFIKRVIEGRIDFLEGDEEEAGIPLIEHPQRSEILGDFSKLASAFWKYKTPMTDDLAAFMLQWLNTSNFEIEIFELIGAFSDALEYKTLNPELAQPILEAVVSKIPLASEPHTIHNIVWLMNVLIQCDENMIPNVLQLIPKFEEWRARGESEKHGWQDPLANIGALYLQLARRTEFPIEATCAAIQLFPPFDIKESASMASAMVEIAGRSPPENVLVEVCLAIARFITLDDVAQAKAAIPQEVFEPMLGIFRQLAAVPAINARLVSQYGRQRAKLRKIVAATS